jgi:hypothetical protein
MATEDIRTHLIASVRSSVGNAAMMFKCVDKQIVKIEENLRQLNNNANNQVTALGVQVEATQNLRGGLSLFPYQVCSTTCNSFYHQVTWLPLTCSILWPLKVP